MKQKHTPQTTLKSNTNKNINTPKHIENDKDRTEHNKGRCWITKPQKPQR